MNLRQPEGTHEPRPGQGGASLKGDGKNLPCPKNRERRLNFRPSETKGEGNVPGGGFTQEGRFGLISAGVSRSQL